VQLIKRLMGEGLEVQVWDEDVSLALAGSNRQYIEEVSRISDRLSPTWSVLRTAEV